MPFSSRSPQPHRQGIILLLPILLVFSCSKPAPPPPAPTPIPRRTPPPMAKPKPAAKPTPSPIVTPTPTPIVRSRRLAPMGTFYLVEYVSVTSDSGIIGYRPGTGVHLVEDQGEAMVVEAEGKTFSVESRKLTNDIGLAELAARRDGRSQQQLASLLEQRRGEAKEDQDRQNSLADAQQRETESRSSSSRGAPGKPKGVHPPFIYPTPSPRKP